MKKIIKNGNKDPEYRVFLCDRCSCEFKAEERGIDYIDIGQGGKPMFISECPECGKRSFEKPFAHSLNVFRLLMTRRWHDKL